MPIAVAKVRVCRHNSLVGITFLVNSLSCSEILSMNAIITGGTKGIGRAIADKLAKEGYDLMICSRNAEDLAAAKIALSALNSRITVTTACVDMSKKQEVLDFGDTCLNTFDKIDVLINNAGVFLPGAIYEEEDGALETMIETNLYSAYHLTRKLVPSMMKHKSGFIINMASIASFMAYPNGGSYSISKFALRGFSKVLREELKDKGIKVTTIMPGATWSHSWAGMKDQLPASRLMQARDIADTVWSLLNLSASAVVEEVVLRPQLGDL